MSERVLCTRSMQKRRAGLDPQARQPGARCDADPVVRVAEAVAILAPGVGWKHELFSTECEGERDGEVARQSPGLIEPFEQARIDCSSTGEIESIDT